MTIRQAMALVVQAQREAADQVHSRGGRRLGLDRPPPQHEQDDEVDDQ